MPHLNDLKMLQNVSIKNMTFNGQILNLQFKGSMDKLIKFLSEYNVEKFETSNELIEDLFFSYYKKNKT